MTESNRELARRLSEDTKAALDALDNAERDIKPVREQFNACYRAEAELAERRVQMALAGTEFFDPSELRYSAYTRCHCGAGLAYPLGAGPHGAWDCADILTGNALPKSDPASKTHSDSMPFSFYEIKSEEQPSAQGATTRPKGADRG